jgi:hypothetical protein
MLSLVFGGEMMKIAIRCIGMRDGSYVTQRRRGYGFQGFPVF